MFKNARVPRLVPPHRGTAGFSAQASRGRVLRCARRATALLAVASVFLGSGSGCGDEECSRGTTECVSDGLIRTCVPGPDGNAWLVSQCGSSFTCLSDPSRVIRASDEDDAGVRVGPVGSIAPTQPACVGCNIGAHECLGSSLARYCVSGGIWQLDPCDVGESCSEPRGTCAVSDGKGGVQACKSGAMACASDRVAKVCDADGTAWIEQPCAANERCQNDHCEPDPMSACDDGDSCLDNKTAVQCLSRTQGFRLEKCAGELYCEAGRCRGPVCALGSSCIGSNQLRECVDGTSYRDTQCGVNEVCMQEQHTAKCAPLQCNLGTSSCGDPRDPDVDKRKYFSACVLGEGSGVPRWVRGECTGATSCDPALAGTGHPCSQACTKGAERCASDSISGINDGIQTCGDDATWGAVKSCNPDAGARLTCVIAQNPDASQLPKAVCAEPLCQWVFDNPQVGAEGSCEGERLRACDSQGKLAAARSCESGVCRIVRSTVTADGRMPGACDATEQCKTGEELCVGAVGGYATPRYRTCDNGIWGVDLKTCKNDALCYPGRDDKGLRVALCGAQCSPGSRRCSDDGALEACDESGRWGSASFCDRGVCQELGNHDAACVLECMPGTRVCAGTWDTTADGYHSGYSAERVCSDDGRLGDVTPCPDGQSCRLSAANVDLGCLECIGPMVPGGNEEGTTDSRCDPDNAKNVQECSDDNTWAASRACSGSKTCVSPVVGTCGVCTIASTGHEIVCSQSNIADDVAGASCESQGFGAPSAWGGLSDCCANYQEGSESTSSFAYCK